jgi:hypothetical protein
VLSYIPEKVLSIEILLFQHQFELIRRLKRVNNHFGHLFYRLRNLLAPQIHDRIGSFDLIDHINDQQQAFKGVNVVTNEIPAHILVYLLFKSGKEVICMFVFEETKEHLHKKELEFVKVLAFRERSQDRVDTGLTLIQELDLVLVEDQNRDIEVLTIDAVLKSLDQELTDHGFFYVLLCHDLLKEIGQFVLCSTDLYNFVVVDVGG